MKLLGKEISGSFTIPSGIITTTAGIIKKFSENIPQVGVITTKSIGLMPKSGNPEPIYAELNEMGTYINAVGLANPGCDAFFEELKEIYPLENKFLLVSIFGSTPEELIKVAQKLELVADGFELNFSCPHADKGYGMDIGSSSDLTLLYTKAVKEKISKPIFIKLTPNVSNFEEIVKSAITAGADGITAINTVGPKESNILSKGKGGVSGSFVKPKALECVSIVRKVANELGKNKNYPIIGMGGISDANDVLEFEKAGATIFGIGSALTGLDTNLLKDYFLQLESDLKNKTNDCKKFLIDKKIMTYHNFKIISIELVDSDLKIFHFDKSIEEAKAGQFVFCFIPGFGEKPISIAYNEPLMLVVRAIGPFTKKMFELKSGDSIKIRGPYGTHYHLREMENAVLVGGGTGIAPLYFLAKKQKPLAVFIGGRLASQIILKNEFEKICPGNVFVSTNDGSLGYKGFVTDLLKEKLHSGKFKMYSFAVAGPEIMMKKAAEIAESYLPKHKVILSVERYFKCGVGICGICECSGLRMCIDGPILPITEVESDFGKYHRDKTGKKEEFQFPTK